MPRVQLRTLKLQRGYSVTDMNLFLPFCIREDESKEESKQAYDVEYFRQTIERTREAYPGKLLNILVADTLDNHNRQESTAKVDGDRWVALHEPILKELGMKEGEDYCIHRWDDFLEPAEEEGYLAAFKEAVTQDSQINSAFMRKAKSFRQSRTPGYDTRPPEVKEKLIETAFNYLMEDYGVTFFIAKQFKPTLFFSDMINSSTVDLFKKCNYLELNGDKSFAHLQLRWDAELRLTETLSGQSANSNNVVAIGGNSATMFNGTSRGDSKDIYKLLGTLDGLKNQVQSVSDQLGSLTASDGENFYKLLGRLEGLKSQVQSIKDQLGSLDQLGDLVEELMAKLENARIQPQMVHN